MTKKIDLDEEEKEILDAFGEGKLLPSKNKEKGIRDAKEASATYLEETRKVNVVLSVPDFERIMMLADHDGIPYEMLMSSILHKFACGYLSDTTKRH